MATTQLGALLRHIQNLAASRYVQEWTDRQLLDDFAARRNEVAFTELMSRHGPMVLRVCRRVLNHEQDAEDAFQASFLVLARNAGSIRKRDTVGGWLHGVAYRTAMNAKRSAARRRIHEARLRAVVPQPAASPTWEDVKAVLDEEVQRLPRRFREAFVQCVLEGKHVSEAAAELECKEGTVKSRASRARRQLRERLAHRGIELATLLATLSVADSASGAGVPTALAQATIRSGLLVAAGEPAVGVIPSHVAALTAGVTRAMFLTKAKNATAIVLLTGLLIAGAGGLVRETLATKQLPEGSQKIELGSQKADPDKDRSKSQAPKDKDSITYGGRVLGPDGKPLAGAELSLTKPWYYVNRPSPSRRYATTGKDGRFSFTVPKASVGAEPTELVATAKGFGPVWITIDPRDKKDNLTLQLVEDDVPITGQVLDVQGKPVQGATVRVKGIDAAPKDNLAPWLEGVRHSKGNSMHLQHQHLTRRLTSSEVPALPQQVTTDAVGKFRITGIGRDRLVTLRIDAPAIASQELFVLTRLGKAIKAPEVDANPRYGIEGLIVTYYPASFEYIAGPTKPIIGVVRDKDLGKPLAGVTVRSYKVAFNPIHGLDFLETKTDAQGGYRLNGMPKGKGNKILFVPPEDQPYLMVHAVVPDTDGFDPVTVDFELKRGVWIEGKVTDKVTGKSVPCNVEYFALLTNPHLRDHQGYQGAHVNKNNWKADGTFRVVGLPGPGLLAVWAGHQYLIALERDDNDGARTFSVGTDPVHVSAFSNNALARIDPNKDVRSIRRDVIVDPGEKFTGRLVGPDGKPVEGALSYGLTAQAGWERPPLEKAEFAVQAFNPRRPRHVLFRHIGKGLVGVLDAPEDLSKPVAVQMKPGAAITGRLVDRDGRPLPGVELDVSMTTKDNARIGYSVPSNTIKTDKDGRFRIQTLLPGYQYTLNDRSGSFRQGSLQFGDGLRYGEMKNLGDVQLKRASE